jgi:hypothetical protein
MARIPVKIILLNRAEGPVRDVGNRVARSFKAADEFLRQWAHTAPKKGGGYDKTDFKVEWEDGETYQGRYDLQREDATKAALLGPHITDWLTFHAGLRYPDHMTREQYENYLKQVDFGEGSPAREEAIKFLREYEL